MNKRLVKTSWCFAIIILFFGVSIIPTIGGTIGKLSGRVYTEPIGVFNGDTIYVDDDSECPGNGTEEWPYCNIQYAIDDASDGDTVFVYEGIYYESVNITKSINLIGVAGEYYSSSSVIDGSGITYVIKVYANDVKIDGFWLENYNRSGIDLSGNNCTISNNHIFPDEVGINLKNFNNNTIYNNSIVGPSYGIDIDYGNNNKIIENWFSTDFCCIYLSNSNNVILKDNSFGPGDYAIAVINSNSNTIIGNDISNSHGECGLLLYISYYNNISGNEFDFNDNYGILFDEANNNVIYNNEFYENGVAGLQLVDSNNNNIQKNYFNDNLLGIFLEYSRSNDIIANNFIKNDGHATFVNSFGNRWQSNYWDDWPGIIPRPIWGLWERPFRPWPWVTFDWFPATSEY